ncbi:NAD-dependent malic enzyme [Proteiniclasticum sp. BAD-10]|uniref:NAD-dependent malic enzyme n=1 Tax=Proteiniclasticum sediminis TaxID=2804028 RepID=A0A941CM72_9CLOT|nr:malic enzyme-like NAD(P)-binding protein [Proteiniclasticum sediminis]MBR0575236.1 NAD-dependent malic enzyme [Proteiniclasticum sediminis]
MKNYKEEALSMHRKYQGKLAVVSKVPLETSEDLTLAYTPGVAEPCLKIKENPDDIYEYTSKGNMVAVVTNGTAVLGLGDIGAAAGLPVMEGKALLFKRFAGVDAFPICLETKDPDKIVETVKLMEGSFGGINLEDIRSPECVEIEEKLKKICSIPVFHDDQHGTAIVVTAGILNALTLVGKKAADITAVVSGTGAAGSSIIKMITNLGIGRIYAFNVHGILSRENSSEYNRVEKQVALLTNPMNETLTLREAMAKADLFIGVSAAGVLDEAMVASMKKDAIVFAMANPVPEIDYPVAKAGGARVVGTGRSDYPNQVNNVLAFPGIFRGALDVRASDINEEMKLAAARAIAGLIPREELTEENILPKALDKRIAPEVAYAVAQAAIETGVARKAITPEEVREHARRVLE